MLKRFVLVLSALFLTVPAWAQTATNTIETIAKQAILVDAQTGTVLFAKEADTRMPTSSMSKMLTIYLTFEALKEGRLKLDDTLPVSPRAWKQDGSRMFVNPGDHVRVEDLIRGVVIQSGNDASVVFAETLGGTESHFAEMMNQKAQALGMANSHFVNATGLPDPEHYSTARDLATLGIALIRDFPEYYHYFSEINFTFNKITQGNRNPLLYHNIGVDGIKTGHTDAGGFGLTASSLREGRRLVLVVNGLGNMQERADDPERLLEWGYREFGYYPVVKAGAPIAEAQVWLGEQKTVPLASAKDVLLTLPRSARAGLNVTYAFNQPLRAPVAKGQEVGKITVMAPGINNIEVPLLATAEVKELGFFQRAMFKLRSLMGKE